MTTYTVKYDGERTDQPLTIGTHKTREEAVELLLEQLALKIENLTAAQLAQHGYVDTPSEIVESKRQTLERRHGGNGSNFYYNGHRYWMTPEPEPKPERPAVVRLADTELMKAASQYVAMAEKLDAARLNAEAAYNHLATLMEELG